MPSKSTGKTITKIRINKKNVALYFNKERLEISIGAYTSIYLYVGKTLTSKDITSLKEFGKNEKLYNYASGLLKKNYYSEWKIREKLYAKEANKPDVDLIIGKLKLAGLLNDKQMINDLVYYANEKHIGKNKIVKELNDKGIFQEEIDKIPFPVALERQKAAYHLNKLERKYVSNSYEKKKQHIYGSLISLGFDNDIALETIEKMAPKNVKEEIDKIKLDFLKIYQKLSKKYKGQQLYNKVTTALRNKGYSYKEIKKILEDNHYDDWGI